MVTLLLNITQHDYGNDQCKGDQSEISNNDLTVAKGITVPTTVITVTRSEGVTNLPHYKNSRPENLGGRGEKIGVFFTKTIFAFPSGFVFRMIRPLNLEELDGLVAGSTFKMIENVAQMFLMSRVLLQLNHIMFHFSNRVLEAAMELRHVKNIVDLGEVRRQFQSVC